VWRNGGPKPDAAWAAALRALGFSGTNVEGAENPEFAAKLGLDFYADHLVPREMLHRDGQDPDFRAAYEGYLEKRTRELLVRKPSLCDLAALDQILTFAEGRAARARRYGARFVSITDEPSYTSWLTPLDFDQSPAGLDLYRRHLRQKYGTIEALNRAWDVNYASFAAAPLWTTDEIRAREWGHGPPWNFAPWSEARVFADAALAGALKIALDAARSLSSPGGPPVPAGFLGGQPPAAFGGYHWGMLTRLEPDVLEVYDVGAARDLVRALRPSVKLVDTTFLTGPSGPVPAELAATRLAWLFARGGRSAVVWDNASLFEEADCQRPTASAKELGARVSRLRELASRLDGAAPELDSVAIVLSQPSVRMGWLLDARRDGLTWPKRLATHEYEHSAILASLEGWFRLLEDLGYAPSAVDAGDLEALLTSPAAPRVLVFPRCLALDAADVKAIRAFLERGGTALFEGRPALFDASLRGGGPAGSLDDLWGLEKTPFTGFADENCEPAEGAPRTKEGLLYLEPTLTSAAERSGNQPTFSARGAVLVNVSMAEYRDARLDAGSSAAVAARALLTPRLAEVLGPAKVVASAPGVPISVQRERRGQALFLLLTPNVRRRPRFAVELPKTVAVKLAGPGAPPAELVELRPGGDTAVPVAPGPNGWTADLTVDPRGVAVLRWTDAPASRPVK
jgi:hypothetical protein